MLTGTPVPILAACLLGLLLDAALGEPRWLWSRLPHPVVIIGRSIAGMERRLLRLERPGWRQRLDGLVLLLCVAGGAAFVGWALAASVRPWPFGWVFGGAGLGILFAWRSLTQHVEAVANGLRVGLPEGRAAVALIVGRDPLALDEAGVARAAVESLAENWSDGVVAPLFWALLFGLPGALAYKAINTADSMIGHRSPRYLRFGWAAARLDDGINLAPARISGLLIALSAWLRQECGAAAALRALRAMRQDAPRHRSPNAGWPEAATAGALGLRLAGPRRYAGQIVEDAWMGDGRAGLDAADIDRALGLVGSAQRLLAGLVALLLLVASGLRG